MGCLFFLDFWFLILCYFKLFFTENRFFVIFQFFQRVWGQVFLCIVGVLFCCGVNFFFLGLIEINFFWLVVLEWKIKCVEIFYFLLGIFINRVGLSMVFSQLLQFVNEWRRKYRFFCEVGMILAFGLVLFLYLGVGMMFIAKYLGMLSRFFLVVEKLFSRVQFVLFEGCVDFSVFQRWEIF